MTTPNNIRQNVQNYRKRLRARGLRSKTIWVPHPFPLIRRADPAGFSGRPRSSLRERSA